MEFIDQLKSSIDIANVIGDWVRLRKAGPNRLSGLCPFHTEKTPSFSVNVAHQFYYCFGCQAKGDAIKFVQEIEGLSFWEAVKLLAERNGIPLPKRSEYVDEDTRKRGSLYTMHEIAEQHFRELLRGAAGAEARAYLAKRGVTPEIAAEFGLGYADRTGRSLTQVLQRQFDAASLTESGLVSRRDDGSFYDRFRNRLMFPIHSESGKVIGFGARALDPNDEPKYLNSAESPIYKKSQVLYNLNRARMPVRKAERVVLVEGYMDVIGVWAAGIQEVVATCGTALRPEQVRAMKRHAGRVVVNFDPDPAGANATERTMFTLLDEGLHVRVLELDADLDPDEYCKERGADAYRDRLDNARNFFYWLADRARARFDITSAEGRTAGFQQVLLPAVLRLNDKIERLGVVNDVANYLRIEQDAVLETFKRAAAERRETVPSAPAKPALRPDEKILLNLLLINEDARAQLIPELEELPAIDQFRTRVVFHTIFRLHGEGARIGFNSVHQRLDDAGRELLESAALESETETEALTLEQGMACVASLQKSGVEREATDLKARIREAERKGDVAEALRLMKELQRLK